MADLKEFPLGIQNHSSRSYYTLRYPDILAWYHGTVSVCRGIWLRVGGASFRADLLYLPRRIDCNYSSKYTHRRFLVYILHL